MRPQCRHLVTAVLLATVASCVAQQTTVIRVCVPLDVDPVACETAFNNTLNLSPGSGLYFKCRVGLNAPTCAQMVATGQADIVKAGGEEIYTAAIDFGLYPFASEDYQLGTPAGVEYNPVMLVGKPFCDAYANNGFLALQNKGLCSTGYRKTAGWAVPLGALMSSIPNEFTATLRDGTDAPDVVNDAESAAGFFSTICAPRFTPAGPLLNASTGAATIWPAGLCTGCVSSQPATTFCYDNRPAFGKDQYADYAGALQCLKDGRGDVAFLKHTTPLTALTAAEQSSYRLFCPNSPSGPCATVDQWQSCSFGQVRAHSFMGRQAWAAGATAGWINALSAAAATASSRTQLVALSVLTADALAVAATPANLGGSFGRWFGLDTMQNIAAYRSLNRLTGVPPVPVSAPIEVPSTVTVVRVCIPADVSPIAAGIAFNTSLNSKASSMNRAVYFEPKVGFSVVGCQQIVRDGNADIVKLGSSDMFDAYSDFGRLRPYAVEDFLQDVPAGIEYYSVAVVKKEFCDANPTSLAALRGKKMCATGYRKSAGWSVPVGVLYNKEPSFSTGVADNGAVTNDADAVAAFFSGGVCAPRFTAQGPYTDPSTGRPDIWKGAKSLCSLCDPNQTATAFCYDNVGAKNSAGVVVGKDKYADYAGTNQCIQDGAADVTFTKHSAPLSLPAATQASVRLFCPGAAAGACQPLSAWSTCNFGGVKSHALVGRADWAVASTQAWRDAVAVFSAVAGDSAARSRLTPMQVMTADARAIEAVTSDFATWFGPDLTGVFTAMRTLSSRSFPSAPAAADDDSELSPGAIVGVIIGVAVAGSLIGCALYKLSLRVRGAKYVLERDFNGGDTRAENLKIEAAKSNGMTSSV